MSIQAATFLMFAGQAEAAARFYASLFQEAEITGLDTFGPNGQPELGGPSARVHFRIGQQAFVAFDSPVTHPFGFTPAISIFITCDEEAEVDRLYEALSDGGQALMPLDGYPFARRFGWVNDRFGVSWQISSKT